MELDDLLKKEGLDAAGVEDALAWARRRAAELLHDVGSDPELGPLLDGAASSTAFGAPLRQAQARSLAVEPVEVTAKPVEVEPAAVETIAAPPVDAEPVVSLEVEPAVVETIAAPPVEAEPVEVSPHASAPVAPLESTPSGSLESAPDAPVEPARRSSTSQAAAAVSSTPSRPMFKDLRGLQAAFLAEADEEDEDIPPMGAVLRAFQKGRSGPHRTATSSASAPTEPSPSEAALPVEVWSSPEAALPVEASPPPEAALPAEDGDPGPSPGDTTVPAPVPPHDALADESPARADAEAPAGSAQDHGLPAPPEADLDPLAGIDFDDLPGVDEDDEEEDHTHVDLPAPSHAAAAGEELAGHGTMVPMDGPDRTLPSMQAPLSELIRGHAEGTLPSGELTERALNPLLAAEPPAEPPREVTTRAPNPLATAIPEAPPASDVTVPTDAAPAEVPPEEIELLDDEDLLLVEEEPGDDEEELPEWKRALLENAGPEPGSD